MMGADREGNQSQKRRETRGENAVRAFLPVAQISDRVKRREKIERGHRKQDDSRERIEIDPLIERPVSRIDEHESGDGRMAKAGQGQKKRPRAVPGKHEREKRYREGQQNKQQYHFLLLQRRKHARVQGRERPVNVVGDNRYDENAYEQVKQHSHLDDQRNRLYQKQTENIYSVFKNEISQNLGERLETRREQNKPDDHRGNRSGYDERRAAPYSHIGIRERKEGHPDRERAENGRGKQSQKRLDLAL